MSIFNTYFSKLNESSIIYCITGRTEDYPENIHSDVDIIIPNYQFNMFWSFMKNLQSYDIEWIQSISHEHNAHYCIISFSNGTNHQILKPDVCSDYFRKSTLFLKSEYLLSDRILNPKGFYQLSPQKEFIYYLLKKIDKGYIDQVQFNHLRGQWIQDQDGCINTASTFFSKESVNIINNTLKYNDLSLFYDNIKFLKKELHHNLKINITPLILKIKNRINRIINPTGLVVAIMGPDGCGKTTIINGIKSNLTEAFRQNKQFHLYPKKGKGTESVIDPHAEKPRGFIGSILKLLYFVYLYIFGYWTKIYPLKIKSTLVIFDRYYHDLLVDPYRYRHGAGLFWIKIFSFPIPKPDLWILLDAPSEVIQQRKSEVPQEETKRQLLAYHQLFSQLNNAYKVNANNKPEQVIYDAKQIIIQHLKKRNFSRLKNVE
jgi:Thymidylate kinase